MVSVNFVSGFRYQHKNIQFLTRHNKNNSLENIHLSKAQFQNYNPNIAELFVIKLANNEKKLQTRKSKIFKILQLIFYKKPMQSQFISSSIYNCNIQFNEFSHKLEY